MKTSGLTRKSFPLTSYGIDAGHGKLNKTCQWQLKSKKYHIKMIYWGHKSQYTSQTHRLMFAISSLFCATKTAVYFVSTFLSVSSSTIVRRLFIVSMCSLIMQTAFIKTDIWKTKVLTSKPWRETHDQTWRWSWDLWHDDTDWTCITKPDVL